MQTSDIPIQNYDPNDEWTYWYAQLNINPIKLNPNYSDGLGQEVAWI